LWGKLKEFEITHLSDVKMRHSGIRS